MVGRTTRSIYSVSCSGVMFGFCIDRYIIAKSWPVPFTMTGSFASSGSVPRTPCTLDRTSVSATSGFDPSFICTTTVLDDGRLAEVTKSMFSVEATARAIGADTKPWIRSALAPG